MLANLFFYYLPDLKCVTIKSSITEKNQFNDLFAPDHLFNNLLEEDSGDECPNKVGSALLKLTGVDLSDHFAEIGKPYRFAQLNVLPDEDSSSSGSQFEKFKSFINAARQRIFDRLELSKTFQQLGKFFGEISASGR